MDTTSLYRDRIYDNQTVNRRCYESNPVDIVEGFDGGSGLSLNKLLRWGIILLVVYLVVMMVVDSKKLGSFDFGSRGYDLGNYSATSPPTGLGNFDLRGGMTESLSDLSFLN